MRYEDYEQYCDMDRQREILKAYCEHGSARRAGRALGVGHSVILKSIRRIKARAAKRGYAPEYGVDRPQPDGYALKGTSTLVDERTGETMLQWYKTDRDRERQMEMMREAIKGMAEDAPKARAVKPPSGQVGEALLNLYVITDYHFGMLAWGEETGEDWDIEIAEQLFVDWFAEAIKSAPKAGRAVLGNIGDLSHYDGLDSVTPTSGHVLDADTRFQRVVRTIIRVFRRVVEMLLKKYPEVHLIMAEGNHDLASSVWLRELFDAHYANESRVTVELSPDPYYCVEHGKVSLFFHHGHKRKVSDIHQVFAAKFREVFGRTQYSYGHMGHLHHVDVKETPLMIVEQHPTLAGKDSYASRGGYLSQRSAPVITYHREYGEVGRHVIRPEMVQ